MPCEIIPTILVSDRLEFVRRLGIMEGQIAMAQMDIMDGKFVGNTTFTDPKIAAKYKIYYELDLMVEDPGPVLEAWKKVPTVKRAYVHVEIKKPLSPLLQKIRSYGWEAGIAINPDTPSPYPLPKGEGDRANARSGEGSLVDGVLFMTVYPGQNAAPFQRKVIPKIKSFHAAYPNIPIAVDGGVSNITLPLLLKAGVTRFAVGSAIWFAPDPIKSYKKLLKVATEYR